MEFPQLHFLWAYHRPRHRLGLVTLQGRLLGAVAAGLVSRGTLFDLAAQLATGKAALAEALRALKDGGWIAIQLLPEERLVVRLERRRSMPRPPLSPPLVVNRRLHADAWALSVRPGQGSLPLKEKAPTALATVGASEE